MSATLQIRRGAVSGAPTAADGEPLFTSDQFRLYVGYSSTNRLLGVLTNIAATSAPAVTDDAGEGYSPGSTWTDTTNGKVYTCVDATIGAAVWKQTAGTGSGGITQLTGDVTAGPASGSTAATVVKVNGVSYPASPSTNTVPVVTSSGVVTYEVVPNLALANSSLSVLAGAGLSGGGTPALGGSTTLSLDLTHANSWSGQQTFIAPILGTPASGNLSNCTAYPASALAGTTLASSVVASSLTSLGIQASALNMGSHQINALADPAAATDAVNLRTLQNYVQGITSKHVATVKTTAALPAYTYSAGVITFTATGTQTVDGHVTAATDYVLVANETGANAPFNGLYSVITAGATGVQGVWTRSVDMDDGTEFPGAMVFIESGTANALTGWVCSNATVPVVGTDNITFIQNYGAGTYTADETSLHLAANQFSIKSTWAGQSAIATVGTLTSGSTGAGFTVALSVATVTGTLAAARLPAFGSGDVSFASGGGAGTIANAAVTLAKIANAVANSKVLGSGASGSGASYSELSLDATLSVTGTTLAVVSSPKLSTARNINGVAFDGTADITVAAAAGTLTGSTLASGVTASSLTSFGALSAALNLNTHQINNVVDPTSAQDAATKNYTDTVAQGLASQALMNGYITVTVAANAMTVAVKNFAGNDPSASNPVKVVFFGTAGAAPTVISLTAATSFTVGSGATLGTSNGAAFRVWFVGFNDAGTFRLGVIVALNNLKNVCQVRDGFTASSTATAGNSNQTFYTGTAVTTKQYRVLGYATWESGLATAGTWNAAPTNQVQHARGAPLPGDVIRRDKVDSSAVATGTTTIPATNATPLVTGGDQYMSLAPTWNSPANLCHLFAQGFFTSSVSPNNLMMTLFTTGVSGCLKTASCVNPGNGEPMLLALSYTALCNGTGETFTIRAGGNSAGTTTFNGTGGAGLFNGTYSSYIATEEIMA